MTQTHSSTAGEPLPGLSRTATAAGSRKRTTGATVLILIALLWPLEVTALAYNLVVPAATDIAVGFRTTQVGWVFTAMTLVGAAAGPLLAKLGDLHGKKKIMLAAAAVAAIGGVMSATAGSFAVFLTGRALQGFLLPIAALSYSLMRDILPPRWLGFAASLTAGGTGLVTISGPFLAGYLIDHHGFHSVFWLLLVFTAIAVAGLALVPESPVRNRSRLDWPGALLLTISVAAILLGLSEATTWAWSSPKTLGCLIGGVAVAGVWLLLEKRTAEPLIDLDLLGRRPVLSTVLLAAFVYGAVGAFSTILPMMASIPRALGHSYGFGSTAMQLTLFTVPAGIATTVPSFIAGIYMRRIGPRLPAIAGSAVMTVGAVSTAAWHGEKWQVVLGFTVLGTGAALAFAAIPNLVIGAAPVEQQGITAGMNGTLQTLGSTVALQIAFVILLQNVLTTVQGSPIYSDTGFTLAYLASGAFALAAFVAALIVPRGRPSKAEQAPA